MSSTLRVALDVFSGRPNPAWTLDTEERDALLARLPRLDGPAPGPLAPQRLGYRGFVIHRADTPGAWRPWLRVVDRVVEVIGDGPPRSYSDTGQLETWLVEQATRQGFGPTIEQARST